MVKLNRKKYLFLLASIWLIAGLFFVCLGVSLVCYSALVSSYDPFYNTFVKAITVVTRSSEAAAVVAICLGVLSGFFIGKNILSSSVKKDVKVICSYAPVLALFRFYSFRYWFFLGLSIFVSLYMAYLHISYDINGLVKIIIGTSLINGSFYYYKYAFFVQTRKL